MTHFMAKTALIISLSVSLSGCAQIGSFGKSMWGHTKYAANYVTKPVVTLLRPTPKQDYVFEAAPETEPQPVLGTAIAPVSARVQMVEAAPAIESQPILDTAPASAPAPIQMVEAAPITPVATPQETNDISFVKIGGGSNMNDWLSCETEAGGFIRVTQSGYLVDPGFESCMRAKGYKPESEVEALIASGSDIPS